MHKWLHCCDLDVFNFGLLLMISITENLHLCVCDNPYPVLTYSSAITVVSGIQEMLKSYFEISLDSVKFPSHVCTLCVSVMSQGSQILG